MIKKLLTILFICIILNLPASARVNETNHIENNYVKIEKKQICLKSRLSTVYNGYIYNITNISDNIILIKKIDIWSNASGKVAYLSVKKTNKTAASETFTKGKKYAVKTLGLALIAYGIASPFSAIANGIGNSNAENEANEFDKKNIIDYKLKSNETLTIKTMAMKRHSPVFKLIFVNPITDENMDLLLK